MRINVCVYMRVSGVVSTLYSINTVSIFQDIDHISSHIRNVGAQIYLHIITYVYAMIIYILIKSFLIELKCDIV